MPAATNGKVTITAETPKQLAIKVWRFAGGDGRLYWRSHNPRWQWDQGVIARSKRGTGGTLFYSVDAILDLVGFESV